MCNMAADLTSAAYFINLSHHSVCLYVYTRVPLLGNGSVDTFLWQQTHATIQELLEASFSVESGSYERRVCGSVYPPIVATQCSADTFPRQRRIVGGVFLAVYVVSKESRRLVLPRTCCVVITSLSLWVQYKRNFMTS
jgi:hypothetical protein